MQTSNEYKSAIDCVKRTLKNESVQQQIDIDISLRVRSLVYIKE